MVANDIDARKATSYSILDNSVQVIHAPAEPEHWGSTVIELALNLSGMLRGMV